LVRYLRAEGSHSSGRRRHPRRVVRPSSRAPCGDCCRTRLEGQGRTTPGAACCRAAGCPRSRRPHHVDLLGCLCARRGRSARWTSRDDPLALRRPPGGNVFDHRRPTDVLFVGIGQILTSAGSAAGIDLELHIIRRDHGAIVAAKVAGSQPSRRCVITSGANCRPHPRATAPRSPPARRRRDDKIDATTGRTDALFSAGHNRSPDRMDEQ
jgi:hypothetical protein